MEVTAFGHWFVRAGIPVIPNRCTTPFRLCIPRSLCGEINKSNFAIGSGLNLKNSYGAYKLAVGGNPAPWARENNWVGRVRRRRFPLFPLIINAAEVPTPRKSVADANWKKRRRHSEAEKNKAKENRRRKTREERAAKTMKLARTKKIR